MSTQRQIKSTTHMYACNSRSLKVSEWSRLLTNSRREYKREASRSNFASTTRSSTFLHVYVTSPNSSDVSVFACFDRAVLYVALYHQLPMPWCTLLTGKALSKRRGITRIGNAPGLNIGLTSRSHIAPFAAYCGAMKHRVPTMPLSPIVSFNPLQVHCHYALRTTVLHDVAK